MKEVFLTVGPRGAGKSMFCEKALELDPELVLISRDKILIELFGTTGLSPYTNDHVIGWKKMEKVVQSILKRIKVQIILDCWNGFPEERRNLTEFLRTCGAEKITAWYFVTSEEICTKQRLTRDKEEGPNGLANRDWYDAVYCGAYKRDHALFHSMPVDVDQGFDEIIRIDPFTMHPKDILRLQIDLDLIQ